LARQEASVPPSPPNKKSIHYENNKKRERIAGMLILLHNCMIHSIYSEELSQEEELKRKLELKLKQIEADLKSDHPKVF
jgi:hypothetical protein